jgi:hypothetical protein
MSVRQYMNPTGLKRLACGGALCAALGAFGDGASAAHGAIIDIEASTNATVRRSQADQVEAETLLTKRTNDSNTRVSYLRFALDPALNENDITSATLRLTFVTTDSVAGTTNPDNVRVWGLLDNAANGTTTETNWTSTLAFADQPAGALANSTTALPTASTTSTDLSLTPIPTNQANTSIVPTVIDIPLTLAAFQSLVAGDTNNEITLLFHTQAQNVLVTWAALNNNAGHLEPTLRLDVNEVPEPGSVGLVGGALAWCLSRRRRRGC